MQPIRNQIHSQLQQRTYTINELAKQYRTTTSVIQVQLDRLKSEGKEITVTDDEVYILHNEKHWIWPIVFWTMIIAVFLFLGTHQ